MLLAFRYARANSLFGRLGDGADHRGELVQYIQNVAPLIPKPLTRQAKVTFARNLSMILLAKPFQDVGGQGSSAIQIPSQLYPRVHLVDVLTAWASRSRISETEFGMRDGYSLVDRQDTGPVHCRSIPRMKNRTLASQERNLTPTATRRASCFVVLAIGVVGCGVGGIAPANGGSAIQGGRQDDERPSARGDWPSFLGPERNGIARGSDWEFDWRKHPPKILWTHSVGTGYGAGSVSAGRYYHFDRAGDDARLVCLDLMTGRQQWEFRYATDYRDMYGFDNGPRGSPTIDENRVYIFGAEGMLHCLNAESGERVWSVDTATQFHVVQNFFGVGSTPVVHGDLLWVMIGGSPKPVTDGAQSLDNVQPDGTGMVAFDKRTGEVRLRCIDDLASYASPVVANIDGQPTGVAFMRSGLCLFDPDDGSELWSFRWRATKFESVNASTPVVTAAGILITESYGPGGALLPLTRKAPVGGESIESVWHDAGRREKSIACHWCTPVVVGDHAWCSSGEKKSAAELRCVRLTDGEVLWTEAGLSRCSLTLADGHLLCLGETGRLSVVMPDTDEFREVALLDAEIVRLVEPCWASPVAVQGLVIVRDADKVVCLDLRKQK